MAFGKKKENKKKNGAENAPKKAVSTKHKGKGRSLAETVDDAMNEALMDNEPFITGGRMVAAATSVSDAIGDLSNRKDENVGQIVNYINIGTISAIVKDQMIADDIIIIIPDKHTMETMRNYDSFREAEYEMVFVDPEGTISPCHGDEEVKVAFEDIEKVLNGKMSVAELIGIKEEAPAEEDGDGDDYSDPLYDDLPEDLPEDGDDAPEEDFTSFEMDGMDGDFMPETEETESEPAPEPEPEPEPDVFAETTNEPINKTAARTFMVDDIELTVTGEPFDASFNMEDLVLFDEHRPTDAGDGICDNLNTTLNNMAKTANAELRQARDAHIRLLRTEYMNTLGAYVKSSINSELSTVGNTNAAAAREEIEQQHKRELDSLGSVLDERKSRIDKEYEEGIENARNAAAEAAEHEYRENHQKEYIAQVDALKATIEQEIEGRYINAIAEQNEDRMSIAQEMLDDAVVSTIEHLTGEYADMVESERAIYQKHMESMLEFLSRQRYNELNRIKVLQDEHARTDIAEKMSSKHAADVAEITAKFNAQKRSLEADIEAMRNNIDVAISNANAESERTINSLKTENQRLTEAAKIAEEHLHDADARAEEKYRNEIESLHNQITRWEEESAKLHSSQRMSVAVAIGLSVAAAIAACAIGYISGQKKSADSYVNPAQSVEAPQSPAQQQPQQPDDGISGEGTDDMENENGEDFSQDVGN